MLMNATDILANLLVHTFRAFLMSIEIRVPIQTFRSGSDFDPDHLPAIFDLDPEIQIIDLDRDSRS